MSTHVPPPVNSSGVVIEHIRTKLKEKQIKLINWDDFVWENKFRTWRLTITGKKDPVAYKKYLDDHINFMLKESVPVVPHSVFVQVQTNAISIHDIFIFNACYS